MRLAVSILSLLALPALAGPYDGIYRPSADWADGWDCRTIGSDGGALAVRDGKFFGVENTCDLTNPVNVRGMSATLFDAVCAGEGMVDTERMMLMSSPDGIVLIRDGFASELKRCD